MHFYFCVDVSLTNSKILNPIMAPETDGVDVDSSANVYIAGNHIECGDDGVALKSGSDWCGRQWATPTVNVTIERNFFNCESAALSWLPHKSKQEAASQFPAGNLRLGVTCPGV